MARRTNPFAEDLKAGRYDHAAVRHRISRDAGDNLHDTIAGIIYGTGAQLRVGERVR